MNTIKLLPSCKPQLGTHTNTHTHTHTPAGIGVEDVADGAWDEAQHTPCLVQGMAQVPHHTLHDGTGSLAPLLPHLIGLPRHQAAWDELEQDL